MQKLYLVLSLFASLLTAAPAFAQRSWQWGLQSAITAGSVEVTGHETDSLGRTYVSFRNTTAPGIVINGTLYPSRTSECVVVAFSRAGQFRWARDFPSVGNEPGADLDLTAMDRKGNIYVNGFFADSLLVGPYTLVTPPGTPGSRVVPQGAATIKLDSLGNVLWARQNSGSDDENGLPAFNEGATDRAGNFYGFGSSRGVCFDGFCFSDQSHRVVRYNPAGQVIGAYTPILPSSAPHQPTAFTVDGDGNAYIAGYFSGTVTVGNTVLTADPNRNDIFIAKFGPVGNVLWVKREGSVGAHERPRSIQTDRQGNWYLTGTFEHANATLGGNTLTLGSATMQSFLAKYNAAGQLQWVHKPEYQGTGRGKVLNAIVDDWGNLFASYLLAGTGPVLTQNGVTYSGANGTGFLLAYSPAGAVRWVEQGMNWNLNHNDFIPGIGNKRLTVDHGGGVYYTNRVSAFVNTTTLGPYTLTTANGPVFRAKLRDCGVVKATVVSPLTGTFTLCNGAPPIALTAKVTSGGPLQYQWQRNNASIMGATDATYSTLLSGDYRVIVHNFNGCTDTSAAVTLNIINQSLPPAAISVPTITQVCLGDSVVLTANAGTGFTYQWKRGTDFITGATRATLAAKQSGNYSVVVTSPFGCSQVSAPITITVNQLPAALIAAAGTTAICQNQRVTLIAAPGTNLQYQWQLNGTSIAGATSISYAAGQAGSFTVRVTNANGCAAVSNSIPVTINPLPGIVVNASGSTSICQNGSVSLSTPGQNNRTYQWQRNGLDIAGATATTLAVTQPGDYRVFVSGNTANLCSNYSQVTTVSLDPGPVTVVTAAGPTAICPGSSVTLVANAGMGYTYRWYKDNALLANATTSVLSVTTPGAYRVEIANSRGCFNASTPVAVTTAPLPTPIVTATGSLTFCTGGAVALTSTTAPGWQYQWQRNGVPIAGATTAAYSATQAGDFRVVVTTPAGCTAFSNQLSATLTPRQIPVLRAAADSIMCAGSSVNLFTTTPGTYQWLLNGSLVPGATQASFTATQAGNYRLLATNAAGCTDTSRALLVVIEAPAPAAITAAGPLVFCTGDSVRLRTGRQAGLTYQWSLNGVPLSGAQADTLWARQAGLYRVQLRTPHGCLSVSMPVQVQLHPLPVATITPIGSSLIASTGTSYQWYLNGMLVPNANGQIYVAVMSGAYTVSVATNGCTTRSAPVTVAVLGTRQAGAATQLHLFPNPATSQVQVTLTNAYRGDTQVQLVDVTGRLVQQYTLRKQAGQLSTTLDVTALASGLYLVRVQQGNNHLIQKLLITH